MYDSPRATDSLTAIRLTIPAKPEYITLGRLALTGIARLRPEPMSQEVLGDLKLALTEACTNSVRHAYDDGEGLVEIVYELHADSSSSRSPTAGRASSRPPARAAALDATSSPRAGSGSRSSRRCPTSSRSARATAAARGCVSSRASLAHVAGRRQLIVVSNRAPFTYDRVQRATGSRGAAAASRPRCAGCASTTT